MTFKPVLPEYFLFKKVCIPSSIIPSQHDITPGNGLGKAVYKSYIVRAQTPHPSHDYPKSL